MSLLQNLELTMFADNTRSTSIAVGDVTHTVPLDTVLNCGRKTRMSSMILHYCTLRDDNPEAASHIFAKRSGQLFPHILHYADTGHLVYPADLELSKTLVRDLGYYGLIRIRDGYCHQCLMEYFKLHGLDDFRKDTSGRTDNDASFPFLHLIPDTVIIKTEVVGGDLFAIRAWGSPRMLDELFPKKKTENDATYFHLSMCMTVIHTDLCEFLKEVAITVCSVVKKLGFRVTCFSSWSDESSVATYGQWLLFRELPAILPAANVTLSPSRSPKTAPQPQPANKKLLERICPCCYSKKKPVNTAPMDYPDLPAKKPETKK